MSRYLIDSTKSKITFSVKHLMMVKVQGVLNKITGEMIYDKEKPETAKVDASIDADSINTRDLQRDVHLKGVDFLDVEHYPTITFHSKRIDARNGGLKIYGDLTIHGVTNLVLLDLKDPIEERIDSKRTIINASANAKIKRKDFGLNWNPILEAGSFLVGDNVNINVEVEFIKQPQ